MKLIQLKPIFISFLVSIVAFAIHKIVIQFFLPKDFELNLIYPIYLLYAFFYVFTVIILFILIKIKQANINNVGFSFMFLTCIKLMIAYFFMQPILNSESIYANSEKFTFFMIFILFLVIETLFTIRILNNKQ